jgi:hypothetical protein
MTDDDPFSPDDPELERTVDAADNAVLAVRKDTQKRLLTEVQTEYRRLLSTAIGRRLIWELLQTCHTFEQRFANGPNGFPQPDATWFHAGEQSVGLRLYQSLMRIDRAAVFVMHDENDANFAEPVKAPRRRKAE